MCDQIIGLIEKLVGVGAAVTAGVVAVLGLKAWRQQLRANVGHEASKNLLRAVFKVRNAVASFRQPFVPISEIAIAVREAGGDSKHWERAVYSRRWEAVLEAATELEIAVVDAEVLWGQSLRDAMKPLEAGLGELGTALSEFLRYSDMEHRAEVQDEMRDRYENTIHSCGRGDEFGDRFAVAIASVEAFLRPKIDLMQKWRGA